MPDGPSAETAHLLSSGGELVAKRADLDRGLTKLFRAERRDEQQRGSREDAAAYFVGTIVAQIMREDTPSSHFSDICAKAELRPHESRAVEAFFTNTAQLWKRMFESTEGGKAQKEGKLALARRNQELVAELIRVGHGPKKTQEEVATALTFIDVVCDAFPESDHLQDIRGMLHGARAHAAAFLFLEEQMGCACFNPDPANDIEIKGLDLRGVDMVVVTQGGYMLAIDIKADTRGETPSATPQETMRQDMLDFIHAGLRGYEGQHKGAVKISQQEHMDRAQTAHLTLRIPTRPSFVSGSGRVRDCCLEEWRGTLKNAIQVASEGYHTQHYERAA